MIRAFFGLSLSPAITQHLLREFVPLKKACGESLQPIDPSLFHITVKFLHTIDAQALAVLSNRVHELVTHSEKFTLNIKKITIFPNPFGHVVAAYVVPHPALLVLHHELEDMGLKLGVAREGRRYRPHITLGKLTSAPGSIETIHSVDISIPVEELMLYESRPGANGSHYIPLRHFPFLK